MLPNSGATFRGAPGYWGPSIFRTLAYHRYIDLMTPAARRYFDNIRFHPSDGAEFFSAWGSIILNPVELVRVWTVAALKSSALFGPQLYEWSKWAESASGQLTFIAIACIWIIVPLFLVNVWMKRGKRYA